MDLSSPTLWWIAAGVLVAAELATGTFYLLMVALGCVAGAVAAYLGLSSSLQMTAAAMLGGGATFAWHLKRTREPRAAPAESNHDVNLDIGQTVQVPAWDADGSARVQYRGAAWSVRLSQTGLGMGTGMGVGIGRPGPHVIVAIRGSELQVAPTTATNTAPATTS